MDGVTIRLKDKLPSKCMKCGSKEIAKGIRGWCYVSSSGNYCYHVACMKEMILESWRRQQETGDPTSSLALQCLNHSQEMARQSDSSSSKAKRLWKKAITVVMLFISAIFGDPTSLIIVLAQQLISN